MGNSDAKLENKAYWEIKQAIYRRQLLPGMPIREVQLAQYLGISRTPVRQALRRLAHEGLVEIRPRRGTYVTQASLEEAQDTFLLRAHLEGLAARLAAGRITAEELQELDDLLREEERAYLERRPWDGMVLSNTWHKCIADIAGHERLKQYIKELIDQSYVYFALFDVYQDIPRCSSEHRRIMDALRRGEGREAERLMVDHLHEQLRALSEVDRPEKLPWTDLSNTQ